MSSQGLMLGYNNPGTKALLPQEEGDQEQEECQVGGKEEGLTDCTIVH